MDKKLVKNNYIFKSRIREITPPPCIFCLIKGVSEVPVSLFALAKNPFGYLLSFF
jgi:hypothetical protein